MNCNRESVECESNCPCHENCPFGSPCDVSFLVLSSFYDPPKASLFNWQVGTDEKTEELVKYENFYGEGTDSKFKFWPRVEISEKK